MKEAFLLLSRLQAGYPPPVGRHSLIIIGALPTVCMRVPKGAQTFTLTPEDLLRDPTELANVIIKHLDLSPKEN